MLDPVDARARAQGQPGAQPQRQGQQGQHGREASGFESDTGQLSGGEGADGDAAAFEQAFEHAYPVAVDTARQTLHEAAEARGETFSGHVQRADFVDGLTVLATQLGLTFEEQQLGSLFDAVSAGCASVLFDDFVHAESTRYYLLQLAFEARGRYDEGEQVLLEA